MRSKWMTGLFFTAFAVSISGCNSTDGIAPTGPTAFQGTIAGPAVSAVLSLTMNSPAAGTLKILGGTTINVAGTWEPATGAMSVSGGGYTISATFANESLTGTFTGPTAPGVVAAMPAGRGTTVEVYCGTHSQTTFSHPGPNNTPGVKGFWNLVRRGSSLVGVGSDKGGSMVITGTITGTAVTIADGRASPATGTLSGNSMSGTWSDAGDGGTWTGSTTAC